MSDHVEKVLEEPKGRILVVDDDGQLLRAQERLLLRAGYVVEPASDGKLAVELLAKGNFDAIISDINMPGMDGVALLRAVRERDLDLPVVLITGEPSIGTAMDAVHHGAFRYLVKPVDPALLERVTQQAVRLYEWAKLRRAAHESLGGDPLQGSDRAGLHASLGRALAGMWMAYQPIVSWRSKSVVGHEALMRTSDTTLPFPGAILRAAERLDRCEDVGRRVRNLVATTLDTAGETGLFFVNLHARDLLDENLYDASSPLGRHAKSVVLELTERAALDDVRDARTRLSRLRELGFRVAIDDLGAGYAGLTSFAQLEPEVVKLDASLIRDVHREPMKRKLVASMAALSKDMGLMMIAEGVETVDERNALADVGCDLMQGYLFARPGKPFPPVSW
jgi:EAL domain-containing protein (putative c-di-GMP-specific phosphodiesterase class I)/ActR/RegA family two-component response regulator